MDEIEVYRTLMQESCLPSGIGDVRNAVWKGVDEAGPAFAEGDGYGYINSISMLISSMAAAVMLGCVIAGYVMVDDYMKSGALFSPYGDILDGMYSMVWRVL